MPSVFTSPRILTSEISSSISLLISSTLSFATTSGDPASASSNFGADIFIPAAAVTFLPG
jgi:hypothetical protein